VGGYGEDLTHIHDAGFSALAELAAERVLGLLSARGIGSGLIVELGCGAGVAAQRFTDRGYEVLGVDGSPAMIAAARRRAPAARFRVASFADAALPPCRAIVAIGEVLNYRWGGEPDDPLPRLFRRAHAALAPDGLFVCDLAGPGRGGAGGPARSWAAGEDWAVLAEAEEDAERRVLTRRITTFRRAGEGYRRGEEVHRLHLYGAGEALAALRASGFHAQKLAGYGAERFAPGHYVLVADARPSP
jgi:SAM-dependent methyltransferase